MIADVARLCQVAELVDAPDAAPHASGVSGYILFTPATKCKVSSRKWEPHFVIYHRLHLDASLPRKCSGHFSFSLLDVLGIQLFRCRTA